MIPLYKPYMPTELPELNEILQSGELGYGNYGKTFEKKLSSYLAEEYIITVNSFNLAFFVVLTALGIKHNDEVISSPMACLVSGQPLVAHGVKVVWADIDPATGTLCPESVKENITANTKAIFHNHYCGYPGYIDEINAIGKEYGIPVIDDGIEAFGSEYKGKKVGNCGTDITMFSFGAVRIPNTIDGGAIIFKDKTLYERSKLVRDSGINRNIFRDEIGEISPACDISLIGYSATMSEANSYIGLQQMEHVSELISKQRINALHWQNELSKNKNLRPMLRENIFPNYWVYGILTNKKTDTIKYFREKGFYASGVHINNNIYSVFGSNVELRGVNEFYNSFVALPSGWWVEDIRL